MVKNELKGPLTVIATCMVTWILMFGGFVLYAILNADKDGQDIRIKHLQQHHDEQVKYDRMIELLEDVKSNTE